MCTGLEFIAYAALAGLAAGGTAVAANVGENVASAQKSAAEEAARTQTRLFEESTQRFEQSFQTAVLPGIPEPEVIKDQAKAEAKKRRQVAAQTILTSPSGIIGEPQVFRKTLLGQ